MRGRNPLLYRAGLASSPDICYQHYQPLSKLRHQPSVTQLCQKESTRKIIRALPMKQDSSANGTECLTSIWRRHATFIEKKIAEIQ